MDNLSSKLTPEEIEAVLKAWYEDYENEVRPNMHDGLWAEFDEENEDGLRAYLASDKEWNAYCKLSGDSTDQMVKDWKGGFYEEDCN